MVDIKRYVDFDPKEIGINEKVKRDVLMEILEEYKGKGDDAIKKALQERIDDLIPSISRKKI